MKNKVMVLVIAAMMAAITVRAEVNVNVSIGVPAPRVVVSSPSVRFDMAPLFVAPSRLGFYVGVDTPYDIIFNSDYYYLYYSNSWHRSWHHNGPWVEVHYRDLPHAIRKHRIEQIRSYRDREYHVYRRDRDHYRGRHFRPDHDRKEHFKDERRHDKEEWKDEHRHDREAWKDERRHDREERKEERRHEKAERKEEKRDSKHHGRGRD